MSSPSILDWVAWSSLLFIVYTYVGYPVLLALVSRVWRNPVRRGPRTPRVSIVIAAANEAARLPGRIRNLLELDYPRELLEVVVVSDGSTDSTDIVVRRFEQHHVTLVRLDRHVGKAVALNAGVAAAGGEIVVFADARQQFSATAVSNLVSNFADPHVGAVTGELVLSSPSEATGSDGLGLYWRLEKWIRSKEAELDSVVGVTGAIYAVRRELWIPLEPGTILDDVLVPMRVVMQGYRVVFDRRAVAMEPKALNTEEEFKRKVRTLAGNYQAVSLCPDLVKPWKNRLFVQYVSHKLFRLGAPFALVALLLSTVLLVDSGFAELFWLQAGGYALAFAGFLLTRLGIHERLTSAAFSFCLLNLAALVGAIRYFRHDPDLWGTKAPYGGGVRPA